MKTGVFKQRFMGLARYLTLVAFFMFAGFQQVFAGAEKLKRAEFEFHVGPAFPLGGFAKPAFSNYVRGVKNCSFDYHGAKIGVNYGLAFQYYIASNWGILIMFNGHSNKVQVNDFSPYSVPGTTLDWRTDSKGKWTEFMALAGATYRCCITDWLVFSLRAYLGYAHLLAPYYSAEATHRNSVYSYSLKSASDANFGFGAGAAFKFIVKRGFHLDLRCDYMGAVPFYFRNVESKESRTVAGISSETTKRNTFHENFNMVNLSFGFTVAF